MIPRGPNVCRGGRARKVGAVAALAGLLILSTLPARAGYAPLDSPEVRTWLQNTAAHALKVAEPDNDLRVGGIAALNRSLSNGLTALDRLAPPWLQRVDVSLRFDDDLHAAYRLATVQPVVQINGRGVVDLQARFAYDQTGATSSRIGFSYRGVGTGDALDASLRGGIEQNMERERYILEAEIDWVLLSLSGRVFNDLPLAEATADTARRNSLLDGYDLDAEVGFPFVSWLRAQAKLLWRENNGNPVAGERLSLEFRPLRSLRIETGTSARSGEMRDWFARLRVKLEFGGPA